MLSNLVGKSISLVESSIYFKIVDILDGNFLFRNVRIIRKIKRGAKNMFTLRVDDEIELQLLEKHHKEELYQLINQNRNHLRRWLPWVDGTKSADAYNEICPMWLKKFAEGDGFESGIRYKGKLVGMVGIHPVSWGRKRQVSDIILQKMLAGKVL